jgi:hypothetical protein
LPTRVPLAGGIYRKRDFQALSEKPSGSVQEEVVPGWRPSGFYVVNTSQLE